MDSLHKGDKPIDLEGVAHLLDIPEFLIRSDKPKPVIAASTALAVIETTLLQAATAPTAPVIAGTREAWLESAVDLMRPWFKLHTKPLPDRLRVSIGFAFLGRKFIGECWNAEASSDGTREIFLSPISEPLKLLGVLVHELCHAALPSKTGHRKPFQKLAAAIGLVGPWKSTSESPGLVARLNDLLTKLGPIPHATLNPGLSGKKKQSTRLGKCQCKACGYTVRVTAKWLAVGAPLCPGPDCDAQPMTVDGAEEPEEEGGE